MGKSLRALTALVFYLCASGFIIFAVISPHWVIVHEFFRDINFGLWHLCLASYCITPFTAGYYDVVDKHLGIPILVLTQLLMVVTVGCVIVAGFLSFSFINIFRDESAYEKILDALGKALVVGGVCGVLAVIIFFFRSSVQNVLGWGYGFAVIGAICLLIAGILLVVERED